MKIFFLSYAYFILSGMHNVSMNTRTPVKKMNHLQNYRRQKSGWTWLHLLYPVSSEAVGKEELKKIPFIKFGSDYMNFEGDDIKASSNFLRLMQANISWIMMKNI